MKGSAVRVLTVGNMYPPHHLGGYELIWHSTVEFLRSRGHDVRVLTTDARLEGVSAADDLDVHRELQWYWADHAWPRRTGRQRLAVERHNAAVFERHCRDLRPDVVTWWSMGGMSMSLLARGHRAGVPSVALVHDDWMLYGPHEDQWLRMTARRPWAAPLARALAGIAPRISGDMVDEWLFVSDWTRRRALRGGWVLPHADVVHSGVDAGFQRPAPSRPWSGRLLCVGRLDERKGVDTAVAALPLMADDTTLTVVGEGDEQVRRALLRQVGELDLQDRVSVVGGRTRGELPEIFGEHDALIFPVRWDEPWGLVPLEAMALGRPVVATAPGGSAEYLRDGENALVVERDDPGAIARAVGRLAADRELRERLRAGGLRIAARHTEAAFNERVLAALERVTARVPGRGDDRRIPAAR